jgi:transmembrane protein TMEM260 (protein O-mannosyltransferase)
MDAPEPGNGARSYCMSEDMTTEEYAPPYRAALWASLGVLALYVITLAPTTAFWDASEYIATAHIVGIPHPPGNPLFVMLGRAWSLILAPLGLPVAVRINLLAAVTSAGASGFLFLVAHRVLWGLFDKTDKAVLGALASVFIGATTYTVWSQSTVNEKVYTVSVFVIAAVTWLAVRWRDQKNVPGSERLLLWAIFLLALGSTNHPMSLLPVPALGLFVLFTDVSMAWRKSFLMRVIPLGLVGMSFNFVLPVRAELQPVINEGEPRCESFVSAAQAVFTNGRSGCAPLSDNLTRKQYQTPPVTQRKAPFGAQAAMYLQYFDWQWSRGVDASEQPGTARVPFTLLFAALGFLGLYAVWRVDRGIFIYLFTLTGTLTVGLVIYLNFKYGFSLNPEIADAGLHEVRERDYFYVGSFLVWGSLAGIGLGWVWHTVAGMFEGPRRYRATAPVLLVALIPLFLNWGWASRAGDYAARDWAYDLLMSVEPYGVLFTNGDNDTFPLWYVQEVEGVRKDVTVIVGEYLRTNWYAPQLQRLTTPELQRPFDPEVWPGLYEDPGVPAESIMAIDRAQLDQIAPARLADDLRISFPGMVVLYQQGMVLDRVHQIALSIIHDSLAERPIFFASSGGLMSQLGLERWGVRHGLAVKLEMRNLENTPPRESWVQGSPEYGGEWYDLESSLMLYQDVYQFRGIKDRPIWQDRSTLNIPWQYYVMTLQLSDVARAAGVAEEEVLVLEDDAQNFQIVAQGGVRGTPGVS